MINSMLNNPVRYRLYVELVANELEEYANRMNDDKEQFHQAKQNVLKAVVELKNAATLIRAVNPIAEPPLKPTWMNWITLVLYMLIFLALGAVVGLIIT